MTLKTRIYLIGAVLLLAVLALVLGDRLFRGEQQGLRAAFNAEFLVRPDGYPGLSRHYAFSFPSEPVQMDTGLMYRALADDGVDVICGFATDGRIKAYNLFTLEDDKNFFPPYFAAPLIRGQTLIRFPQLAAILNRLAGRIDDTTMQRLNYRVDDHGESPYRVARDFLVEQKLIGANSEPGSGSGGTVVVGGKEFTEQEVLGEIIAILIENNSDLRVERRLNLGGTMICFNALKSGDIDLYVEYTGTGLVTILKEKVIHQPQKAFDFVKKEFVDRYDLVWLAPLGFNNTYTLTMRKAQADELNIKTISDLAAKVGQSLRKDQ